MIPEFIKIKNDVLPDEPGVYFYYGEDGTLLYIGKATSLKKRVGSYFTKAHDGRIAELVGKIARIEYIETPSVIEALVLEANQIRANQPPYNIMSRDDKSFLYLVFTNEEYPRPQLLRGLELERLGVNPFSMELSAKTKEKFLAVFGPYTSGWSLKKSLEILRRIFPWSTCQPPSVTGRTRPCFDAHLHKCPGVCTGAIDVKSYREIIKHLILFYEGNKKSLVREMKKEMEKAAKEERFEDAARLRNQLGWLEHIQDVALISKEDVTLPFASTEPELVIDLNGRIEAYDISNISGTSAVGSMVVFEEGKPAKQKYRKFKIKTVKGSNDVAMMEEVMRRRIARGISQPKAWELPVIMVIDGGEGQVHRVQRVLQEVGVSIPLVGIAKGFDRKQDRLVFDEGNQELARVALRGKETFQKARDEAHRFAVKYHREVRGKASIK
ncbi:excinuclease ABC subunit UvrC [Candidatus Uhrbacteria bacterium]|nr:excinuclease ABC subunit UvrC [Candidatus Uhrbacteria bacterium]